MLTGQLKLDPKTALVFVYVHARVAAVKTRKTHLHIFQSDPGAVPGNGLRFEWILDDDLHARPVPLRMQTDNAAFDCRGDAVRDRVLNQRLHDQRRNETLFTTGIDLTTDLKT